MTGAGTSSTGSEVRQLMVIGGGIAGASTAYFAALAGWAVTLLDAGEGRASDVPTALLNPVRGQSGQVDARAQEGLALSWSLIRSLERQGHPIRYEQSGMLRPLATDRAREKVERHLPESLPHRWLAPGEAPPGLAPGWPHLLFIPKAGWVAGADLIRGLTAASRATVRQARAVAWDASSVTMESGERLTAEAVVWCGGSVGAAWGGGVGPGPASAIHRGGSLLLLDWPDLPLPVSSGVYLAPWVRADGGRGSVLGATFEAPSQQPNLGGPALRSLQWLLERSAALMVDRSPVLAGIWTGSRLSGGWLGRQPGGWWALTGLGSKGFLLGPLLARDLIAKLTAGSVWPELSSPGE